ncbi:hypothetical protein GCM10025768_07360 [Microbacterium pseudoresistens]|uniref:Choice-of-anchor G family protein n=1 Tax=Microbacterium pseudoresistens TaxID=640634 RepID=A0A7Y9EVG6_9MICO|nr:hypothetical protein [Microbacterium pseudoresistens]NYD54574.1 hypothetical protein [Microbacterium pseudoresistens]
MTEEQPKGISRRTVVKGAAWSVPVIAAAVAVPARAASLTGVDVGVTYNCVGNYDLALLDTIEGIPGAGPIAVNTVTGLLSAIGLEQFSSRGFNITAVEGTIPAGTQFTLTVPPGLIDLSLLPGTLQAGALGIVTLNTDGAIIELTTDLNEGETALISLQNADVDLDVAGTTSLALNGADDPSTPPGAPNSADLSLISVNTTLGEIVNLGALSLLLGNLDVTLQLCPGQDDPTQP